jgi:hypothetical protein
MAMINNIYAIPLVLALVGLMAHTAYATNGKTPWVENDITWNWKAGHSTSIIRDSNGHVRPGPT